MKILLFLNFRRLTILCIILGIFGGVMSTLGNCMSVGLKDSMEGLSFQIISDKKEYRLTTPIKITLVILNKTKKDIVINKRLAIDECNTPKELHEISFDIKKPSGEKSSLAVDIFHYKLEDDDFIILKANEKYTKDILINNFYEFNVIGKYHIKATYENTTKSKVFSEETWVGKIHSNELVVKLKKY